MGLGVRLVRGSGLNGPRVRWWLSDANVSYVIRDSSLDHFSCVYASKIVSRITSSAVVVPLEDGFQAGIAQRDHAAVLGAWRAARRSRRCP